MPDAIETPAVCECEENTRWCDGQNLIDYTYNHDIQTLTDKINRFIIEAVKAESANVHTVNTFDLERFNAYLQGIKDAQGWINATPQLDLPNTYPRKFCLEMVADVPKLESDGIRTLVRLLELMRDELIRGQSSRQGSGLNKFDNLRLSGAIDKVFALLKIAQDADGKDYPNSTPMVSVTGGGAIGPKKV